VEGAACRDVQTLGTCVRRDDEISTRCECVPVTFGVSRSFLVVMVGVYIPADAVLLVLPVRTLASEEQAVGVVNVFLQ
jgi:hypothetical protein